MPKKVAPKGPDAENNGSSRAFDRPSVSGILQVDTAKQLGGKAFVKVGGFFTDFKNFINQGNALDLAVAFIMGVAFSKIISSLVDDIFNPCISMIVAISLENVFWVMRYPNTTESEKGYTTLAQAKRAGAITLNYGRFAESLVNFVMVAFCLFGLMKIMFLFKFSSPDSFGPTQDCIKCKEPYKESATRCPHCCFDFEKKKNAYVIPNDRFAESEM